MSVISSRRTTMRLHSRIIVMMLAYLLWIGLLFATQNTETLLAPWRCAVWLAQEIIRVLYVVVFSVEVVVFSVEVAFELIGKLITSHSDNLIVCALFVAPWPIIALIAFTFDTMTQWCLYIAESSTDDVFEAVIISADGSPASITRHTGQELLHMCDEQDAAAGRPDSECNDDLCKRYETSDRIEIRHRGYILVSTLLPCKNLCDRFSRYNKMLSVAISEEKSSSDSFLINCKQPSGVLVKVPVSGNFTAAGLNVAYCGVTGDSLDRNTYAVRACSGDTDTLDELGIGPGSVIPVVSRMPNC